MKLYYCHIFFTVFLLSCVNISGQAIRADKNSFGVDKVNGIIVWQPKEVDSKKLQNNEIKRYRFKNLYKIVDSTGKLSHTHSQKIQRRKKISTLFLTRLPIVQIKVNSKLNKSSKVLGQIAYYTEDSYIESLLGIEFRGNLSLTYPKKTFDLEIWTDSINEISKDLTFQRLRNDDDWILDGLYNEPLRIRSHIANSLWKSIHSPAYVAKEPTAKSGIDSEFVEVFKNDKYLGIFSLSESVDRKLLSLKKVDEKGVNGELFKASSYDEATTFENAPKVENLFPHWGGFEMEYPIVDYKSHWEDLAELINLVAESTDEKFNLSIGSFLNIENAIDYYLFVNLLRATDNLGKNYYLARYDRNSPYFFVPWDLDGVMGIIQDGKRIPTTDDILGNHLFDRLLSSNLKGYKEKLKKRWIALRKNQFSNRSLFDNIDTNYRKFKMENIYEREYKVWPNQRSTENDYAYLHEWLTKRLVYLDSHFENL